jgi:hypothetical protein
VPVFVFLENPMSTEADNNPTPAEQLPVATNEAEQEPAAPETDVAFEAGFADEESAPAQTLEAEPEPEPEPLPELEIAGFKESQIRELLTKVAEVDRLREAQAKAFGHLGSLRQSVEALRNQPRPSATDVRITKEKFTRLAQAFPEMADMIAADLSEALQGTGQPAIDPQQYERMVESKLVQAMQAQQRMTEARLLSVQHPDFQQVNSSPEFQQWKTTLDPKETKELEDSWDAAYLSKKLTEFKDWKSKTATSQATKRSRLEAAITPRGGPAAPAKTLDDAFLEGFKGA